MYERKSFGEYIRKKRLEMALTQKELGQRLFVAESTVSKWERGLSYPDVSLVTAICEALGISEHEFFAACDDDQAHARERQAAMWRGIVGGFRWVCAVGYAIALVACFICNLAIEHRLDWFWIVLTAIGLAFSLTNLPFRVKRDRLPICLGAATGWLLLLLLACWGYVGGHWLGGGVCISGACLVLPWGIWGIWRFYGKNVAALSAVLTSLWVFGLLAVIWAFTGGDWLARLGFPLAAVGVAFGWGYLACFRWLPAGRLLKAGAAAILTSLAMPVFNCLSAYLLGEENRVTFWGYFSLQTLLERRSAGDLAWVNILVFLLMLLSSLFLLALGVWGELRRRREG